MSSRGDMRSVRETLLEHLSQDAKILTECATLFGFAAVAISGEPFGLAAGLALIAKTAGSAIAAGLAICHRFFTQTEKVADDVLPKYDRFRVLFYMTSLRCYIEAMSAAIDALAVASDQAKPTNKADTEALRQLKKDLQSQAASLDEAEVNYLFCIEPLSEKVPLFDSLDRWLASTLSYYGVDALKARDVASKCNKEARTRFRVVLATDDPQAEWMRRYLDITREETTGCTASRGLGVYSSNSSRLDASRLGAETKGGGGMGGVPPRPADSSGPERDHVQRDIRRP